MNNDEGKEFDLVPLFQYLWSRKWVPVLTMLLCFVAAWGYYQKTTVITYSTSFQLRLPQYCSNKDYNTAVTIAKSAQLQNKACKEVGLTERLPLSALWIKDTSMITVSVSGTEPTIIKAFADAYMPILIKELDTIVNEQFIRDMQINNLQNGNPLSVSVLKQQMEMKYVQAVQIPYPPLPHKQDHMRIIASAGLVGFFGGIFLLGIHFLYKNFSFSA